MNNVSSRGAILLLAFVIILTGIIDSIAVAGDPGSSNLKSDVRLYQEIFNSAERAYLDGQYDLAIRHLVQCLEMDSKDPRAFRLINVVMDEKAKFVGSKSYEEFIQNLGLPESEKIEQSQARIKQFVEVLKLEMMSKMENIYSENAARFEGLEGAVMERVDSFLQQQNARVVRQDERIRSMGLLLGLGALVCGIFILLAIYLLVTVFRLGAKLETLTNENQKIPTSDEAHEESELSLDKQNA